MNDFGQRIYILNSQDGLHTEYFRHYLQQETIPHLWRGIHI
jgi:hypothetical protein